MGQKLLAKLQKFDTPTISNVIELFQKQSQTTGFMDGRIKACYPQLPPMVGYAATATCRTAITPRGEDAYHHLLAQVERFDELAGPPVVVFQDLDSPTIAATFGEIMCTTYKTFGAVGLITSGGGRDMEQVAQLDFPVFTETTICSHGYIQITSLHEPVHVGGMAVYPGDLLHGDLNGVTAIPLDIADEVADAAAEFVAAEKIILDVLHSNNQPTLSMVREAIESADQRIAQLKRQIT